MLATVLGGAGFIGSALTRRLLDDGHDVRVVDFQAPTMPYRGGAWAAATDRFVCDLRDTDSVTRAVLGSEWVFHLAADVGGVGYLTAHDYRPFFNNMQISMNVLNACERLRVDRLFYTSSSCVYPVHLQDPAHSQSGIRVLKEDVHIETGAPDLMYGREKLMTLRLCERAPFDARVGIVNTVFGPGLKLSGDRMKYPAAVTVRAVKAAQDGGPLTIWGDGSQTRGYLHVGDAVDKIVQIMTGPYKGPVNITSTEVASCDAVARMVLDILDVRLPLEHVDGPPGVNYRHASNEKYERVYGPDTQRTMREAFEDFVPWVQASLS